MSSTLNISDSVCSPVYPVPLQPAGPGPLYVVSDKVAGGPGERYRVRGQQLPRNSVQPLARLGPAMLWQLGLKFSSHSCVVQGSLIRF